MYAADIGILLSQNPWIFTSLLRVAVPAAMLFKREPDQVNTSGLFHG
jgi:hypothetical protein